LATNKVVHRPPSVPAGAPNFWPRRRVGGFLEASHVSGGEPPVMRGPVRRIALPLSDG
jgi:hypothetical protein